MVLLGFSSSTPSTPVLLPPSVLADPLRSAGVLQPWVYSMQYQAIDARKRWEQPHDPEYMITVRISSSSFSIL